jgi:hypothetical protein
MTRHRKTSFRSGYAQARSPTVSNVLSERRSVLVPVTVNKEELRITGPSARWASLGTLNKNAKICFLIQGKHLNLKILNPKCSKTPKLFEH